MKTKRTCENCWWHSNEFYEDQQLKVWCDLYGFIVNGKADVSQLCHRWTDNKPQKFMIYVH